MRETMNYSIQSVKRTIHVTVTANEKSDAKTAIREMILDDGYDPRNWRIEITPVFGSAKYEVFAEKESDTTTTEELYFDVNTEEQAVEHMREYTRENGYDVVAYHVTDSVHGFGVTVEYNE